MSDGVAKLDPATGRTLHFTRIPNHSEWDDLAYGSGAVWYLQAGGVLHRINATSLKPDRVSGFGGDPALRGRRPQSWSWVAATRAGVCVGRLASGSRRAVLCFDRSLRHHWLLPGGPDPLIAAATDRIYAGGTGLTQINLGSRPPTATLPLPGSHITALDVDGSGLWAAVEPESEHPKAEIWHIVGRKVVSRTKTGARYIEDIAVNYVGVWVLYPTRGRAVVAAVEPNGAIEPTATLPADARSLVATPGALWTANFRDSTVARITGYASID